MNYKFAFFWRFPDRHFFRIHAPSASTINRYFKKACTVRHAYTVEYLHGVSTKNNSLPMKYYHFEFINRNEKTYLRNVFTAVGTLIRTIILR